MPVPTTALIGMIVATAFAAGLSALAAWSSRRRDGASPWWGALAVGFAYAIGHAAVAPPAFPPAEVTDRVLFLALAGAVVAAVVAASRGGAWARSEGYRGLALAACLVMLGPILGGEEMPIETRVWLAATTGVALIAAWNVALLDSQARRYELWAALIVYAIGAGVVLVLGNSAVLLQLGGVLAVVLAASIAGSWGRPVGGGAAAAVVVLTAIIIEGFVYASLPTAGALTLAAAPLILWLTRIPVVGRLGPKTRAAIAATLVAIPTAIAAALVLGAKAADGY